ncbi:hypothetical protein [Rhizobium lentis]|uniref:Uncharacterized protein n=1 Tax=Rhizobium lentis TaxID=1138194 RepID=A0A9Q3MEX8_9HYPH|nr:hypothetical protein [Rhizobium lentis]MBX5025465.1 hypothetical protein [Rhizobium lentis]
MSNPVVKATKKPGKCYSNETSQGVVEGVSQNTQQPKIDCYDRPYEETDSQDV